MKILTLLACVAAAPALAQCPTAADLAGGIRVVEANGTAHIYRSIGNGVVQVDIVYSDGYESRNLLGQGVHVVQLADAENGALVAGTITTTSYGMAANQLPVPTAGMIWEVDTVTGAIGDFYPEAQSQNWGDAFPLVIGACTYDAIPGTVSYESEYLTVTEGIYFLPEAGIGLLYSYKDSSGFDDKYTFAEIAVVN